MKHLIPVGVALCALAAPAAAQHMDHAKPASTATQATLGGQYAFATISEIVTILKADPSTDWTKVNLEALRQHLIDMDEVMLRSRIVQKPVPGGIQIDVTGTDRTIMSIKRMARSHAHVLEEHSPYQPAIRELANGVRLTVVAKDTTKAADVAMLRGLGFAGLMVEGDHHAEHHLMMARGTSHH